MTVRWVPAVFTLELRKILSYRADFWIQFAGSIGSQIGVAWFLWRSVFDARGIERVGDYTFGGLMLYYVAAPLLLRTIQGAEMGQVSDEIYEGGLTRYLLYPVSFFLYKFAQHLAYTALFLAQCALLAGAAAAAGWLPAGCGLSPASCAMGVAAVLGAAYLYFVLVSAVELTAFWADNVWSLVVLVRFSTGLLGGALLPLALFPAWAQALLGALPFAYFVSFPVNAWLGRLSWPAWGAGMAAIGAWSAALTGVYALAWNRGKYRYTGVGI